MRTRLRIRRRRSPRHKPITARFLNLGLPLLGLLVLLDLVAAHFSGQIEAALTFAPTPLVAHVPTTTAMLLPTLERLLTQDSFQRADQILWGNASDGQPWIGDAMKSSHFFIASNMGQVTNANGIFDALIGSPQVSNSEVLVSGSLSHFASTSNLGAILRWADTNNLYKAYIDGAHVILLKKVAGVVTVLKVAAFTAHDGMSYTLRFHAVGTVLAIKVWPTGQPEPTAWMIMIHDSALTSGYDGIRFVMQMSTTALITSFMELGL